jgi:hypothetical protein
MSKLNRDVLYLILEELQNDKKSLYSCLLVNETWCNTIVPILWKNPWKYLKQKTKPLLLNVIISHLSNKIKENIKIQDIRISQEKPLFNYISFCRYLDLRMLEKMISDCAFEKSRKSILRNEIFNLFINENTKFTHLYVPDDQIHLIPGAKHCFSELAFLGCSANINNKCFIWINRNVQINQRIEDIYYWRLC